MKLIIIKVCVLIIIIIPEATFSQGTNHVLDQSSNLEEVSSFFHKNIAKDKDKYCLYDEWRTGDIYLCSGTIIKGFPLRYDLRHNLLEITINEEVKVQTINRIEWFTLLDENTGLIERYSSCEDYKYEDGSSMTGVCKIHSEGSFSFITNVFYVMKEPDFIPAFDVGNKGMKVFVKSRLLLCNEHIAYPKPTNKRAIYRIFGSESQKAASFVEQEELNPKRQSDLMILIDYMNDSELAQ